MELVKCPINGLVLDQGFKNQDCVTKGTVIAKIRLDQQEYRKKHQQENLAEIDLQIAREQLEHAEELYRAKAISDREVFELKVKVRKQEVYVSNLVDELKDQEIKASFNGMIVNKQFNHLLRVYIGADLLTLVDAHDVCVELSVNQQDITRLHVGQNVIFSAASLIGHRDGRVTEISPIANPSDSQNMPIAFFAYSTIILQAGEQILFGSSVDAEIELENRDNVLMLPLEAVLYRESQKIVFVIENGKAWQLSVETGNCNEDFIEIVSGLTEGDKIITRGNLDVENNSEVVISRFLPTHQ